MIPVVKALFATAVLGLYIVVEYRSEREGLYNTQGALW